jgi:hypothetical protein
MWRTLSVVATTVGGVVAGDGRPKTPRMKRIDTLLLGPETWTFASESGGATLAP